MKKILFTLISSAFCIQTNAQYINKMYTGSSFFSTQKSVKSSTGGHLVYYQPMMGGCNLISLDANANILWNKAYEANSMKLTFNDFCEVSGGKLIAVKMGGAIESMTFNSGTGAPLSHDNRIINAGSWSPGYSALMAADGNDAVFVSVDGARDSIYFGKILGSDASISFIKVVDLSGLLGNPDYNYSVSAMNRTSGGQYLVLCDLSNYITPGSKQAIAKFDASGNVLFFKYYDCPAGTSSWYGNAITEAANGDILVSGRASVSSANGSYLLRFDANANFIWGKHILNQATKSYHTEHANGDITLCVSSQAFSPDNIARSGLVNLSSSGNFLWATNYGYSGTSVCGISTDVNDLTQVIYDASMVAPGAFVIQSAGLSGNMPGCSEFVGPITTNTLNFSVSSFTPSVVNASLNLSSPAAFTELAPISVAPVNPDINVGGVISNPACFGQFGNVNISVSGGYPNYSYSWSNGTSNQNLLNVLGGTYYLRVADAKGCAVVDTFNVIEPPQLSTTYTVSQVTCFGSHNGSINVTTSGGTPGYHWQWTTQDSTEDLSNLSGGFYQLTVTDANGCTKTLAVSVSEPQQLIAGILSSQNVKCHGACDGGLTGVASGGTPPYTYLWNNPGSATTTTVGGLCPGNYLFSVIDAHNCFTFANAVITEPAALSISTSEAGSLCGGSTGMAVAQVTGGVTPYSYLWSNSTANDTAASLTSGSYTVTATDANNCVVSSSVNVGLVTPTPDICMVTVDSLSTHNILIWDKTPFSNVAYFNIYREDITNNYTLIAAVNYDSLSVYHDYDTTMADPNVTTKRYKISAVDTCGNESAKSNFHNTIFIQHNNGTFTWNTYTIQNSPNPVTSYRLMRDDYATGNWQQIGITAGTQNVLNDPNYSGFATTADWRVETVWSISCTATLRQSNNGVQGAVVKSKSNISNNRVIGVRENGTGNFVMYPNPAADIVTIAFEKDGFARVEVINTLGETVKAFNTTMQQTTVSTSDLASGVYYVKVNSESRPGINRLVIQK